MVRKHDPYDLDEPAVVAFSGGRTSGYMAYHCLQSCRVRPRYVFCNTGKEREETLDFVHACDQAWGLGVVWLEYCLTEDNGHSFRVVTYETASRQGQPFDAVIRKKKFVPNRVARFCTSELKVKTMWRWAASVGLVSYTKAVGLRADEPRRVAKMRGQTVRIDSRRSEEIVLPLAEANVTEQDVLAWWKQQPFDLGLQPHESNCDLCFLKRRGALLEIMGRRPELGEWWIAHEHKALFRTVRDRPRYAELLANAQPPGLFSLPQVGPDEEEDGLECACTD